MTELPEEITERMVGLGLSPPSAEAPPRPETIDLTDIERMLQDGWHPFWRWLDAIAVCHGHGAWAMMEACATRALAAPVPAGMTGLDLRQAALALVDSALGPIEMLPDLVLGAAVAEEKLSGVDTGDVRVASVIGRLSDSVAKLRVALSLANEHPRKMAKVSSLLRDHGHPRLAIEAADWAISKDPVDVWALTSRGAAKTDLRRFAEAARDLDDAWYLYPSSHYTALALSRCKRLSEDFLAAVSWGDQALRLRRRRVCALTLAAAAAAAGDEDAMRRAAAALSEIDGESERDSLKRTAVDAGFLLLEEGQPEHALEVGRRLLRQEYAPARALVQQAEEAQRRKRLSDLQF